MPSRQFLNDRNTSNMKLRKLFTRKFFGTLPNPNCPGETLSSKSSLQKKEIETKPAWQGVGSQYTGNGSLDPIDPDDYVLEHDEDSSGGRQVKNGKKVKKPSRRQQQAPKSPPTYNHLKPKFETIKFKIVNMPGQES